MGKLCSCGCQELQDLAQGLKEIWAVEYVFPINIFNQALFDIALGTIKVESTQEANKTKGSF